MKNTVTLCSFTD